MRPPRPIPIRPAWVVVLAAALWPGAGRAEGEMPASSPDRAATLRRLDDRVLPAGGDRAQEPAGMLARDIKSRMQAANLREGRAWEEVRSRADWERYRDVRLKALRESLGRWPEAPDTPRVVVARTLEGDGFQIEDLAFESRPGLEVTGNLYTPAKPSGSMPGILISHSHHNPKTQGELQDMGMTWARQGCVVLVIDHLGHGERRQHPFRSEADYPRPFRAGRQDYYFRANAGMQLHLVGESLMGWMAWDLMRGLDVVLSRPGVDRGRTLLLGAVAGGGDPAGVTAALDRRVEAVVPFNFGGPQPDYPVPDDPARDFYSFGVPDWESTRSLRLGARDGFAQWLIVASVAPRRLVYAHEFAWDRERDPVWPRLNRVFGWYDAADRLAVVEGRGTLRGSPPESSHCNNIGPLHRSRLYPTLERWFAMPIPEEYSRRRTPEELACLTPELVRSLRPRPLHELAAAIGAERADEARRRRAGLGPEDRRRRLREDWGRLLGDLEPEARPRILRREVEAGAPVAVERIALNVERDVVVPLMLLRASTAPPTRRPVVVGLAQGGKRGFLEARSGPIAELLDGGATVCLVDVRGTGETRPRGDTRRHNGSTTSLSAAEGLLGQTLVGARLRDLRSVLAYLRGRADVDARRVALWGDSFTPPNPKDRNLAVPLDADPFPAMAEPLGGFLALFGALFDDDVRAVWVRGNLSSFASLFQGPFVYVPHDALIPGALTAGDLADVAAALAPRPLRIEGPVDGLNREVPDGALAEEFGPVRSAYRSLGAGARLQLLGADRAGEPPARWLLRHLAAD